MGDSRQFNFNVRSVGSGVDPISLASIVAKKLTVKDNRPRKKLKMKLWKPKRR